MARARRTGRPASARLAVALVVIGMLLGFGAGAARYLSTPGEQVATVTLELSAVSPLLDLGPGALGGRPVAVDTDAQILLSDDIVAPVAQVSGRSPEQVREDLSASARPLTRVLDLHYRSPDAASALAGAERAASAFLEVRERLVLAPTLEFLEKVARAPLNTTAEGDAPLVDPDDDLAQGLLSQEDRAAALALELPSAGTVLQAPRITEADDRGDAEVPLTSGAALGGLLGLGLWALLAPGRGAPGPAPREPVPGSSAGSPTGVPAEAGGRRGRRPRRPLRAGIAALALGAAGLALAPSVTPASESEASFLVTPLPGAAFDDRTGNTLVDLGTEAQLALSDAVLARVAPTRGADPAGLRQRLSVRLVPNAEVVVVTARAGTGERASSLAQRIAEATLEERRQRAADTLARRAELLGTRIARTEVDLERASEAEDAEATTVLSQRLVKLREQLKLLASGAQSPGSVLGTETVRSPLAPLVAYGLPLAGALLGALLGWVSGYRPGPRAPRRARSVWHRSRSPLVAR